MPLRITSLFLSNGLCCIQNPLSSNLGIRNLLSKTKLTDEQKEYLKHLNTASNELDEVIAKINKALDNEGKFIRKTLEKLKEGE